MLPISQPTAAETQTLAHNYLIWNRLCSPFHTWQLCNVRNYPSCPGVFRMVCLIQNLKYLKAYMRKIRVSSNSISNSTSNSILLLQNVHHNEFFPPFCSINIRWVVLYTPNFRAYKYLSGTYCVQHFIHGSSATSGITQFALVSSEWSGSSTKTPC